MLKTSTVRGGVSLSFVALGLAIVGAQAIRLWSQGEAHQIDSAFQVRQTKFNNEQVAVPPLKERAATKTELPKALSLGAISQQVTLARGRIDASNSLIASDPNLPADHWARNWTGVYSFQGHPSPGGSTYVSRDEITYSSGGCFGTIDCNVGDVLRVFDSDNDKSIDGVVVQWRYQVEGRELKSAEKLYFVDWQGTDGESNLKYLVAEADMLRFVNDFNRGSFYRNIPGMECKSEPGAARPDDWGHGYEPRKGVPKLPAPWANMLLKNTLDANVITQVAKRITIDKGSADGVYLGMEFSATDIDLPEHYEGDVTIESVQEHSAVGVFEHYKAEPPRAGTKLRLAAGIPAATRK